MFGFVFGTLCLIGLIKLARHGRCGGYGYYGRHGHGRHHGFDGGGHGDWHDRMHGDHHGEEGFGGGHAPWRNEAWGNGPWGRGGGRWGGGGKRFFLRAMFERLDTTPGQEKVIVEAFDQLRERGRAAKNDLRAARAEVAKAMRSPSFDEVTVGTATAQLEGVVESMRKAGIDAFAKIHEALDERQRGLLGDFIEHGPRFRDFAGRRGGGFGGHPYRYSV